MDKKNEKEMKNEKVKKIKRDPKAMIHDKHLCNWCVKDCKEDPIVIFCDGLKEV